MQKLNSDFYNRSNVVKIAKELIGKILVTQFGEVLTSGRIVETEAYAGVIDRASHAYGGRRTARTSVIYNPGGVAYVYLCYGIHYMFNVVTNVKDTPHAILIRGIEPMEGIPTMLARTGKKIADNTLTRGPGNVCKALGIDLRHTGLSLLSDELYIAQDDLVIRKNEIITTPRIGVDYAGGDAKLPYRFILNGNPYVSGKKANNL